MHSSRLFRHLPNTLTLLNLVCGCLAIPYAYHGRWSFVLLLLIACAVFDFFDGLAARWLGVSSPLGKELDSLADVVSFGAVPSMMIFHLLQNLCLPLGDWSVGLPYTSFCILAFSALRLAKFNIDTRQSQVFIGLPTPANALFWAAFVVSLSDCLSAQASCSELCHHGIVSMVLLILGGIAFSSWLMVSEVPMFALKFKRNDHKALLWRLAFLGLCLLLCLTTCLMQLPALGIACSVLLYVVISIYIASKTKASHTD